MLGDTSDIISPLQYYDPMKYVTPEKVKEVTDEYEQKIEKLEQTVITYQKQIASKDDIIGKYQDQYAIIMSKVNIMDMMDDLIAEKDEIEQELVSTKQEIMGKDRTISHKSKHPHESTTIMQLQQQINDLTPSLRQSKEDRTKMDQSIGHIQRQRDELKETVKQRDQQI